MNKEIFIKTLEEKIAGVLYISESENPFSIEQFGNIGTVQLPKEIAKNNSVDAGLIKISQADAFFARIEKAADPNDAPIAANAKRIKNLYEFLKEHLADIIVYRVENGVRIQIYIMGLLPDETVMGVKTVSIES